MRAVVSALYNCMRLIKITPTRWDILTNFQFMFVSNVCLFGKKTILYYTLVHIGRNNEILVLKISHCIVFDRHMQLLLPSLFVFKTLLKNNWSAKRFNAYFRVSLRWSTTKHFQNSSIFKSPALYCFVILFV